MCSLGFCVCLPLPLSLPRFLLLYLPISTCLFLCVPEPVSLWAALSPYLCVCVCASLSVFECVSVCLVCLFIFVFLRVRERGRDSCCMHTSLSLCLALRCVGLCLCANASLSAGADDVFFLTLVPLRSLLSVSLTITWVLPSIIFHLEHFSCFPQLCQPPSPSCHLVAADVTMPDSAQCPPVASSHILGSLKSFTSLAGQCFSKGSCDQRHTERQRHTDTDILFIYQYAQCVLEAVHLLYK